MKPFFEIKYSNGLARRGKLNLSNKTYSTPFIIIPNQFLSSLKDHYLNSDNLVSSAESLKYGIISINNLKENIDSPVFIHNRSIFGINYGEQEGMHNIFNKIDSIISDSIQEIIPIKFSESCVIFHESPPAKSAEYFLSYERALNQKRLALYESEFKAQLDSATIKLLGVNFSTDKEKMSDIIRFLSQHSSFQGIYVKDLYRNLFEFNEIFEFIMNIKADLPYNYLLVLGGQIPPGAIPLLIYLGVDGFDMGYLLSQSAQGLYISDFGGDWIDKMNDISCNCIYCRDLIKNKKLNGPLIASETSLELNMKHLIWKCQDYLIKARFHLDNGLFREFVENESCKKPEFVSLLRIMDKMLDKNMVNRYRRIASNEVICSTSLSHFRPEIVNFIETIKRDVFPDDQVRVIVLLPCSATKPYSKSPSHQKFSRAIRRGLSNADQLVFLHEIIITSPLGIVPRDIEEIFPAAHYNVSVTGDWSEEEIQTSADCLYHYLKKVKKCVPVIAHVTGGYLKVVQRTESMIKNDLASGQIYPLINDLNFKFHYSASNGDSATSDASLETLTQYIRQFFELNDLNLQKNKNLRASFKTREELRLSMVSQYQFGPNSPSLMIGNGIYFAEARSGDYLDIQQYDALGKKMIGRIYHNNGFIMLNNEGGKLLFEIGRDILIIKEKELKGTTIFVPILKEIKNLDLKPGDLVAIENSDNEYVGLAELCIAARDAINMRNGAIAIVLKK